jgi:hypothetical protein
MMDSKDDIWVDKAGEISKSIILPNIPSGTYFIKAEGRNYNSTYKVVIRK